ncbi:MAG: carboxypeptidase-like regulatory domain-containing protein [Gemmatimonadota bacterium]|nr:carboxypeptidase-like regulatory domain-containing protein [Gemmatimonadota bacterium]
MVSARFFLPVAVFAATTLQAQGVTNTAVIEPTVAGVVRDVGGLPVSDVEVGIIKGERLQQFVITAADGKFLLTGVGRSIVPLRIRRLGYAMQFLDVDARVPSSATLEIVLKTAASELEEVTIAANERGKLREFYEHRQQRGSFGRFLEQHEIRRLGPTNPSDLFRSVPGIVIATASGGNTMRIRGCQPMVWVDGQRVPGAELDEVIHPSEIAAIEFYPSNAGIPAQYLERGNRLCGSVLVWTRTQ